MFASILELETRVGHEGRNSHRHHDFTCAGQCGHTGTNVDSHPRHIVTSKLDFTGVQATAHLDVQQLEGAIWPTPIDGPGGTRAVSGDALAQVRGPHPVVAEEIGGRSRHDDVAGLEHVAAVGQAQRLRGVLLHEQHRRPCGR